MGIFDSDLIRPLELAENNYLQVLLTRFSLARRGMGAELNLRFDAQTPTIWLRQAKSYLNREISKSSEKIKQYREELDRFLISGEGASYQFDDPDFPFRYGSGGTLPVIKIGVQQYYCLFYREVHPVGWNIANGGCDSRQELLNPWETVERELREELIVVDPTPALRLRYLLDPDEDRTVDHPDFVTAWRLWQPRFRELNFPTFEKRSLLAGWLGGPDSLKVQFESSEPVASRGCFLNINAEDFGIEIDRLAKLSLDEETILCDGEVIHGCLQNRPIGLFEVERFNQTFEAGSTRFVPQWIFYNARRRAGAEIESITQQYLNYIKDVKIEIDTEDFEAAEKGSREYDLCPVTRSLVARILQTEPPIEVPPDKVGPCEVFISFASEDAQLARSVYDYLVNNTTKRVFFSEETKRQTDFGREIDEALDAANCLITVASSRDHLMKEWVKFEWDGYHRDILNGRKRNAELLSVIFGFDPRDLPRALRYYEALVFDHSQPAALDRILRYVH